MRTIQKAIEEAAGEVPRTTRNERGTAVKQTLENVRIHEEAAAHTSEEKKSAETSEESKG